jgi:hypothetical protein
VYYWTNRNWTPGFGLEMARPWLILDFGLFCNFETLKDCPANNKKGPDCKTLDKKDLTVNDSKRTKRKKEKMT